jgi:predicted alpha/beta hydrolase family esterase
MKRAVLLHGTDGSPAYSWFPWLKKELEGKGYKVWIPELPENHTPNQEKYEAYLRSSSWDFSDNLMIGHSSGATTILNLLASEWLPEVEAAVLVGTFLNERALQGADWYSPGQFDDLFPEGGFDYAKIRKKASNIYFIHGANDPYCLIEDAEEAARKLGSDVKVVEGGLHLSANRTELPEILSYI